MTGSESVTYIMHLHSNRNQCYAIVGHVISDKTNTDIIKNLDKINFY